MQTLQTQTIDGYSVIVKINSALGMEDPIATQEIVNKKIVDSPTFKKIAELKGQMSVYIEQAQTAGTNAKRAKLANQPWQAFWNEHNERMAQYKACEDQLKPLAVQIKKEYHDLTLENAVYFNLQQGEEYISDEEADAIEKLMLEAQAAMQVLTRDKQKVDDNRGLVFWKKTDKWTKQEITRLGEKPVIGGIDARNLSEAQIVEIKDQIEAERIAALPVAEKAAEKESAITGLKARAGAMHSELLVQGDVEALAKSQAWLASETEKVNQKYA